MGDRRWYSGFLPVGVEVMAMKVFGLDFLQRRFRVAVWVPLYQVEES